MQDNYPKYTSRKAKEWLWVNNIEVMEWPVRSPYLNSVENLWGDIKRDVARAKPTNSNQL